MLDSIWYAMLVLCSVVSYDGNVQSRMGKVFDAFEHTYTGVEYQNEKFQYRLFVPRSMKRQEKYPLLLWLHGAGEYGRDNELHLRWFDRILLNLDELETYEFFVLAPQYPRDNPMWFRSLRGWAKEKSPQDDMGEVAVDMLRAVMGKYPVDPDRIYVAGISDGGAGVWEIAMRYPEMFAAAVPMAGAPRDYSQLEKLVDVPIWAFNNKSDHLSPVETLEQHIQELKRLGGIAHLTSDEGTVHDCWTAAFLRHNAMDWMLAQRRGGFTWHRPAERPLNLWIIFAEAACVVVVSLAVWLEWRRRRSVHKASNIPTASTELTEQRAIESETVNSDDTAKIFTAT